MNGETVETLSVKVETAMRRIVRLEKQLKKQAPVEKPLTKTQLIAFHKKRVLAKWAVRNAIK